MIAQRHSELLDGIVAVALALNVITISIEYTPPMRASLVASAECQQTRSPD